MNKLIKNISFLAVLALVLSPLATMASPRPADDIAPSTNGGSSSAGTGAPSVGGGSSSAGVSNPPSTAGGDSSAGTATDNNNSSSRGGSGGGSHRAFVNLDNVQAVRISDDTVRITWTTKNANISGIVYGTKSVLNMSSVLSNYGYENMLKGEKAVSTHSYNFKVNPSKVTYVRPMVFLGSKPYAGKEFIISPLPSKEINPKVIKPIIDSDIEIEIPSDDSPITIPVQEITKKENKNTKNGTTSTKKFVASAESGFFAKLWFWLTVTDDEKSLINSTSTSTSTNPRNSNATSSKK